MRALLVSLLLVTAMLAGWLWLAPGPGLAPAAHGVGGADGRVGRVVADPGPMSAAPRAPLPSGAADAGRESAEPPAAGPGPIHGVVTRADGVPCGGASVRAEASGLDEFAFLDPDARSRRVVASAVADADGRYELTVPAGRPHLLRAEARDLAPATRGMCVAGARVDFVLHPSAALAGVVVDQLRQPVPTTRIVVRCGGVRGEATTGADGTYRVAGLPPGEANVDVQPLQLAAPRDADVTLTAGGTTVYDVTLLEGATIVGRVVDAATRVGIEGAEVGEGRAGRVVRTGPDGSFVLAGFAARHQAALRVAAAGYAPVEEVVRCRVDGAVTLVDRVEVALERGYTVCGRVVDPNGLPLADVYAAAAAADHGGVDGWFRSDWRSLRTDASGRFRFTSLPRALQHEVVLVGAGFAAVVFAVNKPGPGTDAVDLGDLRLGPGGGVTGVVADEHDVPIAGQDVELTGHNADRWRFTGKPADDYRALDGYVATRRARSDAAGGFTFVDLAPGSYAVRCQCLDSHDQKTVAVEVAGATVATVRVELFRGLELGGRITMRDGSVLPKCYCSIDPEDGQTTSADVELKGDGTFTAAGLQRGNYKLTVYPYGSDTDTARGRLFRPREFAHVAAGTHGFVGDLPVYGLVRGSLRTATLEPAVGCFVVLRDGATTIESTAIGPNGAFTLQAERDGRTRRLFVLRDWDGLGEAPLARAALTIDTLAGADPLDLVLPRQ
jgi:protocatechuate 3,4-dioxygenase beta subunit